MSSHKAGGDASKMQELSGNEGLTQNVVEKSEGHRQNTKIQPIALAGKGIDWIQLA